jgi:hypothetical protein
MSRRFENIELVSVDGLEEVVLQNGGWFCLKAQRMKCQRTLHRFSDWWLNIFGEILRSWKE